MKQVWKCDHCSYTDVKPDLVAKHEPECCFNKATKHCYTCKFSREDGYEDHIAVILARTHSEEKKKVIVQVGYMSI